MRKKHDEGYALVFVLVVMTVLSLISISLMTAALKNLQSQKTSVAQMEAKYEAQGEVEILLGEILGAFKTEGSRNNELSSVQTNVIAALSQIKALTESDADLKLVRWTDEGHSYEIALQMETDLVQIHCRITLTDIIVEDGGFKYTKQPGIRYESYQITRLTPSEPEEGGNP